MRVKILDVDQKTYTSTVRGEAWLHECFPDGALDADRDDARADLEAKGAAWVGGGAAPLVLLIKVDK